MKKYTLILLLWVVLLGYAHAQSQKETITKTGKLSNKSTAVLSVDNIHGDIKIEAYNGDQVQLTAEKTITAKNQAEVEKGMREMQLKFVESGDSIYVYLDAPFIFRKNNRSRHFSVNHNDEVKYNYKFDMVLKVPANITVTASTVNDGEVLINNVNGTIKARNVNGSIMLNGVSGNASAHTVNGKVEVNFVKNPTLDSQFKTLNGNIYINYAAQLNASVSFKTMNGEFFTDLNDLELLPAKLTKNTNNKGANTVYKIDHNQSYKVGKGGPELAFETLNGNIYLKKSK